MTPVSTAAILAATLTVPAAVAHAFGAPGGWVGAGIVVGLVAALLIWIPAGLYTAWLGVAAAIGRPSVVADAPDEALWRQVIDADEWIRRDIATAVAEVSADIDAWNAGAEL